MVRHIILWDYWFSNTLYGGQETFTEENKTGNGLILSFVIAAVLLSVLGHIFHSHVKNI